MLDKTNAGEPVWLKHITDSLADLRYGSVHIVVHDGKIVQIERTEKRRFDPPTRPTGGEGAIEN